MEYTLIIILLALLQYIFFTVRVGFTRGKFSVAAPHTSGNTDWECIHRVHQNTLEQLIIFIPSMITFQMYVSDKWVLLPGVLFIVGRQVYSHFYLIDPEKRAPGVILSFFSNIALVVGSLIGIGIKLMG